MSAQVIKSAPWSEKDLVQVAKWQKIIMVILVLTLISTLSIYFIGLNTGIVVRIILFIAQAYCLYRLAVAIRADFPVLYILSCIIPWVNVGVLLFASNKATKILKSNGISVGLLGAKMPV